MVRPLDRRDRPSDLSGTLGQATVMEVRYERQRET
jgi:hypothetical protein